MISVVSKHPAPADGSPACFGLSWSACKMCRECPVQAKCKPYAQRWRARKSLAVVTAEVAADLSTTPVPTAIAEQSDVVAIYRRMYRKHYGGGRAVDKFWKPSPSFQSAFDWVENMCRESGVDIETWITAQMHGMEKFLASDFAKGKGIKFAPNMLRGEKAINRYNIFVSMANNRYRHAKADSFDSRTALTKLVQEVAEDEENALLLYVEGMTGDDPCSFEHACRLVGVRLNWRAVMALPEPEGDAPAKARLLQLNRDYTWPFVQKVARLARLIAACAVADRFSTGFSTRIGFNGSVIERVDFAKLVARLYPHKSQNHEPIVGVEGIEWGRG